MAVYVDPNLPWVRTPVWKWDSVSHLYADTPDELHRFAARIGLKRSWCSDVTQPDSRMLHYDLSPGMRVKAVRAGAVEVDHYHKFKNGHCPFLKRGRNERDREAETDGPGAGRPEDAGR